MKRNKDTETIDMLRPASQKRERPRHVPHQVSSATSKEAAEKIKPVFHGNRQACFHAITHADTLGGTTRKRIAQAYFGGMQNFVTGPVAILIEEGLVYEAPAYRDGFIQRREDGSVVPRRIDGSAVLLLTPKGRAVAA